LFEYNPFISAKPDLEIVIALYPLDNSITPSISLHLNREQKKIYVQHSSPFSVILMLGKALTKKLPMIRGIDQTNPIIPIANSKEAPIVLRVNPSEKIEAIAVKKYGNVPPINIR